MANCREIEYEVTITSDEFNKAVKKLLNCNNTPKKDFNEHEFHICEVNTSAKNASVLIKYNITRKTFDFYLKPKDVGSVAGKEFVMTIYILHPMKPKFISYETRSTIYPNDGPEDNGFPESLPLYIANTYNGFKITFTIYK